MLRWELAALGHIARLPWLGLLSTGRASGVAAGLEIFGSTETCGTLLEAGKLLGLCLLSL